MPDTTKLYVVFDTNIWFSQLGLTTRNGAAVRFFLRQRDAKVAIPEVVSLEVTQNLVERLKEQKRKMEEAHQTLLSIFGAMTELSVPSNQEIEARVSSLLTNIDVPYVEIPFSLAATKASMKKIFDNKSPSRVKEQFKDGVTWANCLDLLKDTDVFFVTNDSAFYNTTNKTRDPVIDEDLRLELNSYTNTLKLFRNLDQLLDELHADVVIDRDAVARTVFKKQSADIEDILASTGFRIDGAAEILLKPYITEVATQINFSFELGQRCTDATQDRREEALLQFSGEGFFHTSTKCVDRLSVSRVKFRYTDTAGEAKNRGFVNVAMHASLGLPTIQHTLRLPVQEEDGFGET